MRSLRNSLKIREKKSLTGYPILNNCVIGRSVGIRDSERVKEFSPERERSKIFFLKKKKCKSKEESVSIK